MAQVKETTIDRLIPDDKNLNKGTEYGKSLLDKSLSKFGAGRSILIDKNDRIIAGNKASASFGEQGGEKVIVVETDGKTLVAVKRTDIDLDSKEGRELAAADNLTQQVDFLLDEETAKVIKEEWGADVNDWGAGVDWDAEPKKEAGEDDFDEEKDAIEVRCKRGDVWQLGEHRLMCGDSIDLEEVKKLMGGVR